jgi:hypothetical protein
VHPPRMDTQGPRLAFAELQAMTDQDEGQVMGSRIHGHGEREGNHG